MRTDIHDIFQLPTQKHNKYLSSKFRKIHRHPSPTELCVTLPKTNSEPPVRIGPKEMFIFQSNQFWGINSPFVWGRVQGSLYSRTQTVHYLEKLPANICIKFDPPSAKNGSHLIIPGVITVLEKLHGTIPTYWFTLTLYSPTLHWYLCLCHFDLKGISLPIWVFPKIVVPPKHPKMIIFSRKPMVVGYHHFRKPPFRSSIICCLLFGWWRPRFYSRDMLWSPRSRQCQEESHDYALPPAGMRDPDDGPDPTGKSTLFFFGGGGGAISNMYIVIWRNAPLFWIHCLKLREKQTERFTGGCDQIHVCSSSLYCWWTQFGRKNSWLDGTYPFTVSICAISFDVCFFLSKVADFKTHQSINLCLYQLYFRVSLPWKSKTDKNNCPLNVLIENS